MRSVFVSILISSSFFTVWIIFILGPQCSCERNGITYNVSPAGTCSSFTISAPAHPTRTLSCPAGLMFNTQHCVCAYPESTVCPESCAAPVTPIARHDQPTPTAAPARLSKWIMKSKSPYVTQIVSLSAIKACVMLWRVRISDIHRQYMYTIVMACWKEISSKDIIYQIATIWVTENVEEKPRFMEVWDVGAEKI